MADATERSPLISDDDIIAAVAHLREIADPSNNWGAENAVNAAEALLRFASMNAFAGENPLR